MKLKTGFTNAYMYYVLLRKLNLSIKPNFIQVFRLSVQEEIIFCSAWAQWNVELLRRQIVFDSCRCKHKILHSPYIALLDVYNLVVNTNIIMRPCAENCNNKWITYLRKMQPMHIRNCEFLSFLSLSLDSPLHHPM